MTRAIPVLTLSVFVLCLVPTAGQSPAYVPSNTPGSGICGTLPFGQAFAGGETYMARIPSGTMATAGGIITDIAFSGCGAGAWSSANVIIGLGHLPSAVSLPVTYPTFDAAGNVTSTGTFLDFSVVYDSTQRGPLIWTVRQDAWSPMNLQASWTWNGVDDVGFYITFQGGLPAAFTGAIRSDFNVFRTWASGFQASQSTNTSSTAGMKMAINPPPPLSLVTSINANGSATVNIFGISPAAQQGWTFISTSTGLPPGAGPFFGIVPDAFTWQELFIAPLPAPGHPLHWVANFPGVFPDTPLLIPSSVVSSLSMQTWDIVAVTLDSSLDLDDVSNLVRITWP